MPSDVHESPYFRDEDSSSTRSAICYSSYQRELSKLYKLASPLIETIFGIRTSESANQATGAGYQTLAKKMNQKLGEWRQALPTHLAFDLDHDVELYAPTELKIHRLQALSLQLTFDNITIVLHRPFLAQQVDFLAKTNPSSVQTQGSGTLHRQHSTPLHTVSMDSSSDTASPAPMPSAEYWWGAAIRTSRITGLPQLAQLATDSHLVAFLAINLFNSAIVMVVCALSDILSDRAQEAKRYITRIFRLQELLGKRSTLPMQSSNVLRDVVRMLLHQEEEVMLATVTSLDVGNANNMQGPQPGCSSIAISVEDTLRVPLDSLGDFIAQSHEVETSRAGRIAVESLRLNESLVSVQKGKCHTFSSNMFTFGSLTTCCTIFHLLDDSRCSPVPYRKMLMVFLFGGKCFRMQLEVENSSTTETRSRSQLKILATAAPT
jgi:hypothetical protein